MGNQTKQIHSLERKFWKFVDKDGPIPDYAPHLGKCWLWLGSKTKKGGYGIVEVKSNQIGQSTIPAHRLGWLVIRGELPELVLDHLCRVRHCVNPDHLEPVSIVENILRGYGIAAINKRKTHCKRGHEFTKSNIYWSKGTGGSKKRGCKTCYKAHVARYKERDRNLLKAFTAVMEAIAEHRKGGVNSDYDRRLYEAVEPYKAYTKAEGIELQEGGESRE